MKTRENELHEPRVNTEELVGECRGHLAKVYCTVCDEELSSYFEKGQNVNVVFLTAKAIAKNYCPNCGARLKEVE